MKNTIPNPGWWYIGDVANATAAYLKKFDTLAPAPVTTQIGATQVLVFALPNDANTEIVGAPTGENNENNTN